LAGGAVVKEETLPPRALMQSIGDTEDLDAADAALE